MKETITFEILLHNYMEYYTEPKRYYWISYHNGHRDFETCVDVHPFTHVNNLNKSNTSTDLYRLSTWHLISAEEQNLWEELNETK